MTGAPVSPQASELLERVLRARPRFREELEALAAGPESSGHVAELVEHGFLAMDGDRVDITPPDRVVAAAIMERIEEDRRATDAVASLLAQLPDLARAWDLGLSPEGQAIQGEVIEGDANALNRWYTLIARMTPNDPGASHPDLSFIHDHVVPNLDRFRDEFFGKGFAIRYLFPASAIASERDRAAIEVLHTLEAPVRVTTALPSWFYVDRGVMAGLPQTWGATSPGGMVMVYSTPVVEAISWLFESLWDAATPLPVATEGWRPVLELMSRGRSDEQIAAMLGLGLRTVRRRIAEAMERFGVTTRFELGAAWARQRS
ncbi:hypothetical protein [Microbacterium sp. 179-I 3D3 NHS]|uniref:helix-turn-helix transcriptional regulator n=1 Tax=Microbacterium sp. 179-I 3D3 NHS TaxID=3142382 RepID=UPI00399F1998